MIEAVFRLIDKDADGKLDREELELAVKVVFFFRATACRRMATNRTGIRFGAIPFVGCPRRVVACCRTPCVVRQASQRCLLYVRSGSYGASGDPRAQRPLEPG